jgi:hypothetical protein
MLALPALVEWKAGAEAELAQGWRPVGYGP